MRKREFIPYGKHNISEEDIQSVVEVLKSDFITQGPKVKILENLFAKKIEVNYATAVNSATSGLHLACLALGLTKGDSIWTSPITFVASANCGLYCDAEVDFVDIDLSTGLVSIEALKEKLEIADKKGKLPKIFIPVHLGGGSCDMKSIWELSKKYGFSIVEDASHCIGSKYYDEFVGNCKYSDICVFSLHPVKIITSGEGGLITTKDKELDKHLKMSRSHGITKDKDLFKINNQPQWAYEQQYLGFNYRMSDIHAALGISQLSRVDEIIKKRHAIRSKYISYFNKCHLNVLSINKKVQSSNHLFIILLKECDDLKNKHKEIFNFMRQENIGVQLHYIPVHNQPYYKALGFKANDFPNAEKYAKSAISLPIYPELNDEEIRYVSNTLISKIKEVYN